MENFSPRTRRTIFAVLLATIAVVGSASANTLEVPGNRVILTVKGKIDNTNAGTQAQFDRAMLESLPQVEFQTATPWTDGQATFRGPLLRDVLAMLGANGEKLIATALNDYQVEIPVQDALDHEVILALKMDGLNLRVRTKGPLWIMYPWSDNKALDSESYYSRSIWQLQALDVR